MRGRRRGSGNLVKTVGDGCESIIYDARWSNISGK
jgi:hypothetical protein